MPRSTRLLGEERRRKILEVLDREGRVMVDDLVRRFKVSAVTARADLDALAERGTLVRSHGGAVRLISPSQDYPLKFKEGLHHGEKVRIAGAAMQFIQPGFTILLDSGTTTGQIARQIRLQKIKPLTVITNALNIAMELADFQGVSLIMIGGILRHVSNSFVGPQAERMLQDLHADHCFLAVDGLDAESGLSTPDVLEAQLNALMIKVSSQVTAVADASKFGRRSLSVICAVDRVRRIITDDRITPVTLAALEARGVEVLVAGDPTQPRRAATSTGE
ncbi:MAG TPA: DeoR/GlpR family DNA-binding transcription regulator [Bryobacteraceae bacterium]|nr:DeoR/GlpR family DNA-binding transcription regulator [Bryobacteraceae bacterium]